MSGILGLGDVRKLGRPGAYAITYYLSTTMLAVMTGLIVVNIVNPGRGIDKKLVEDARQEGEETVSHAAGRKQGKKFEWHNVTGDRTHLREFAAFTRMSAYDAGSDVARRKTTICPTGNRESLGDAI